MSDLYYVCRTDCPAIGESRFRYLSRGHGWCNRFKDALPFTGAADAQLLLRGRPGSVWTESDLKSSPYYKSEMKSTAPKTNKNVNLHPTGGFKPVEYSALTDAQKSEAAKPLAKLPPSNSPVTVKGTWDGVRYWLNAAKAFEQGKLFSQVMVGFELLALHKAFGITQGKRSDLVPHHLSHGETSVADSWEEICEKESGIARATGYRYMDMAKAATPRLKLLPGLKTFDPYKRSLVSLKPARREELQTAVKKLTDGKSQGEFFGDLYKQKSGGTGREPGCDGTKKKLTLSEEAALRQQEAAQDWTACDRQLWAYKDKFTVLTDTDVTAQIARLEQALNARNAWLKQPLNDRQPKLIADMFPL